MINNNQVEPNDDISDLCRRMLYIMGEGGRLNGNVAFHSAPAWMVMLYIKGTIRNREKEDVSELHAVHLQGHILIDVTRPSEFVAVINPKVFNLT